MCCTSLCVCCVCVCRAREGVRKHVNMACPKSTRMPLLTTFAVLCLAFIVCSCRAREEVRKRVNMSQWQDKPIVAVVSRLTPQKGVHLIKHAAYKVSLA
jgi:hypothetical protein